MNKSLEIGIRPVWAEQAVYLRIAEWDRSAISAADLYRSLTEVDPEFEGDVLAAYDVVWYAGNSVSGDFTAPTDDALEIVGLMDTARQLQAAADRDFHERLCKEAPAY